MPQRVFDQVMSDYAVLVFAFVFVIGMAGSAIMANNLIRRQNPFITKRMPSHRGAWDEDPIPPTIRDWDPAERDSTS